MPDEFVRSALPRYGRVPRGLLRDPNMSDRAVRLYGVLDDYAGADERAFPKRQTVADAVGCSVSAVAKALTELERGGWIIRTPRFRDDGGQTSSLVTLTAGPPSGPPVDTRTRGGGQVDTGPVDGGTHQEGTPDEGTTPVAPTGGGDEPLPIVVAPVGGPCENGNMDKPVATASRRREVADDDPSWVRFWSVYPRKVSKGAARKAWTKAIRKAQAEQIIGAATRFATEVERRKKLDRQENRGRNTIEFVPYPATWLNRESWLDQTEEGKAVRGGGWSPVKKQDECPEHPGEHKDRCRMHAADRLAGD